jgi:putative ABC transport system substrate-binding protein
MANFDRRNAIKFLGGAAALCPLAARGQSEALPVIGFLDPRSSPDSFSDQIAGFRHGLKDIGFTENENVAIEYAWGQDRFDRLRALAADLVRRPVAVLVASGGSPVAAIALAATTATPIVFAVAQDPVKLGLVASLNRPGGNATGVNYFNVELYAKRLELLRKLLPQARRVAVLVNPADAATIKATVRELQSASGSMGLEIKAFDASSSHEIDAAFAALVRERFDALYVGGDTFLHSRRDQITMLAARKAVPAAYPQREWADVGGLMSYGTDFSNVYRLVGTYTGLILKGEKPADLPIVQPSKFEFVINPQDREGTGSFCAGDAARNRGRRNRVRCKISRKETRDGSANRRRGIRGDRKIRRQRSVEPSQTFTGRHLAGDRDGNQRRRHHPTRSSPATETAVDPI